MINRVDVVVSTVLLALCAYLYYVTTTFEQVADLFAQNITPEMFPRLLIWLMVGLSLVLPFEQYLRKSTGHLLNKGRETATKPIAYLTGGTLCATVFCMEYFGTLAALYLASVLLPILWGERRWKILVPYVVVFPTLVIVLFQHVLGVQFERGSLGVFS